MKDTLQITIIPEDCEGADFESYLRCPLARAILRQKPIASVIVKDNYVLYNLIKYSFDPTKWNKRVMDTMNEKGVIITLTKVKHRVGVGAYPRLSKT